MHPLNPQQVTDVRHHPLIAGFNEPVFVELTDVSLHHRGLLRDDRDQGLERFPSLLIADTIDRGQQSIELFRGVGH
jgi:hypothetical protein